jgi:hypothetical protein
MKRLCQLALAAALFAVPLTAQAQCFYFGDMPAYALIERPHPQENLFPSGGWTLYPGEAGSLVPSMSHYSHVYGVLPPAVAAQDVLNKLQMMGVPIKAPEPQFLGRNPAIADNVVPPTPRSWLPKDEEKEKEPNGNNAPAPGPRPQMKEKEKNERLDQPQVEKDD